MGRLFFFLVATEIEPQRRQTDTLFVDSLLGVVRHALPIRDAVDQDGVESHQEKLTDKDSSSEALNTLFLLEREGYANWYGYQVVASHGDPNRAFL